METVYARADSGFYCWEAVESYEKHRCRFIISARKTARLVEELKAAEWQPSPRTDADGQCEFRYQPEGWGQVYRFVALRYVKTKTPEPGQAEQYPLFETADYTYRVFVTNLKDAVELLVWFYNQRGAENLIKEANNDAGLAAYPSARWAMNCNHFQMAMLANNLNCWLMLFNREGGLGRKTETPPWRPPGCASCSGGEDLATRRAGGGQLQRPLRRAGDFPAADAAAASDCGQPEGVRAGAGRGPALLSFSSVHKILCIRGPSKPTSYGGLKTRRRFRVESNR